METSPDNDILVTTDAKGNALVIRHSRFYTPFPALNTLLSSFLGFVSVWCIENFCLDGPHANTPESEFLLMLCLFSLYELNVFKF